MRVCAAVVWSDQSRVLGGAPWRAKKARNRACASGEIDCARAVCVRSYVAASAAQCLAVKPRCPWRRVYLVSAARDACLHRFGRSTGLRGRVTSDFHVHRARIKQAYDVLDARRLCLPACVGLRRGWATWRRNFKNNKKLLNPPPPTYARSPLQGPAGATCSLGHHQLAFTFPVFLKTAVERRQPKRAEALQRRHGRDRAPQLATVRLGDNVAGDLANEH